MPTHIDSPLGFTADFPEFTELMTESTAGPNTEQYGLLGGILVTVIDDGQSVDSPAGANAWAHIKSDYYLNERGGSILAEGELQLPGKATYAVVTGYLDADGAAKSAATVGVWENNRFLGIVVIWPVVNPEVEPRIDLLKEIVGAVSVG
ncbi:hypothetical protein [Arthrobacter sp. CJ23]|uniref:hypothetical protein n=1 Tax=Arthrobacter sp. CJ23 TaxID=2972479 RepID=UPI00215D4F20|nr:hypothetical protein [Arthrobacter sp. CJ23]UVJ39217.1 hypothetical protein NVV90_18760 [Arthrobacter sp. CJ23]